MKKLIKDRNHTIADKLKKLEQIIGKTPQEMANIGDCSVSTYYRYRSGTSSPDFTFLKNILKNEKNINSDWLLRGIGPIVNSLSESGDGESFKATPVPFYKMKQLSSKGEGSIPVSEWKSSSEKMPICNAFLDFIDHEDFDSVFSLLIQCDAMYPAIKPGSIVLVNKSLTNITEDGIFILKYDNVIRMKLVQKLPNSKVELSTVNKKYNPVTLSDHDFSNIEILGKIFWAGVPM